MEESRIQTIQTRGNSALLFLIGSNLRPFSKKPYSSFYYRMSKLLNITLSVDHSDKDLEVSEEEIRIEARALSDTNTQ